jgi:predicted site-specific integrase-resolvase
MKKHRQTISYVRLALGTQIELHRQQALVDSHCLENGVHLDQRFSDVGSGLSAERPGLCKLRRAIACGEVDRVVVLDWDRLAEAMNCSAT